MNPNLLYIPFLFAMGACLGSFLNVLVYRMPRELSIVHPPSACPQCNHKLAWYDNIPILGWIFLAGKCRYCRKPISVRYPIIEAITALIFVGFYYAFFMAHAGPVADATLLPPDCGWFAGQMTDFAADWPIYFLDMALLVGLLAASLIDLEHFIIPAQIPWWLAAAGVVTHAIVDRPGLPGNLLGNGLEMALSAGSAVGLLISIVLLHYRVFPLSFENPDLLEVERHALQKEAKSARERGEQEPEIPDEMPPAVVRKEIRKEILFLMPPLVLGGVSIALFMNVPAAEHFWTHAANVHWISGGLGALLGGLVGGLVVWLARVFGSLGFGREAMGLGDVHLLFGVGAVLGGGAATLSFFLAPFSALVIAMYMFIARRRRQIPFGPYLSLTAAGVMLFYAPIAARMWPGIKGLGLFIHAAPLPGP